MRSDEAEWWFNAVYEAVQEVPVGRVTTYGHIARLLGYPRRARQVGICLKHLPSAPRIPASSTSLLLSTSSLRSGRGATTTMPSTATATTQSETDDVDNPRNGNNENGVYHHFHNDNVPWQRIINSKGTISHRGPGSAARQAAVLRSEGVIVDADAMGDYYVDMARHGWFPDRLPSEEGESEEEEE